MSSLKPKVLFLCTGNSARSQMAEGYLRHVAGGECVALSAGVDPKGMNPLAVAAMAEIGIDISNQRSKDVREYAGETMSYVVTVCDNAREQCPIFPGVYQALHWSLRDPAAASGSDEERLEVFREVRDELRRRIEEELAPALRNGR